MYGALVDAVGTVIEPDPPVAEVYAAAARRRGVDLNAAEVKGRFELRFRTDELDELGGDLTTDEAREHLRWQRIVAAVLPEVADQESAFLELWKHFSRPQAWRCYDDVAPAFSELETAGIRVWIASNFDARLRTVVSGIPTLAAWADRLLISSEVGYRKPHPAFYLAGCKRLELKPENLFCVGDDPENDYEGPRRAGLQGLLVNRQGSIHPEIPSFADLSKLTEHILSQTGQRS